MISLKENFIVNEQGKKIAVIPDLETYHRLIQLLQNFDSNLTPPSTFLNTFIGIWADFIPEKESFLSKAKDGLGA